MIGLDTNILVRLLTADDPTQTEQAKRFIHARCSRMSPGFVSSIVLTELVWVLQDLYKYGRRELATAIDSLLASHDLALEAEAEVRSALDLFRTRHCDYIDALVGEVNRARGCEATATFDRRAAQLDGFIRIS